MQSLKSGFQHLLFPGWLLLTGLAASEAYQAGFAPAHIVTIVGFASMLLATIMERILPYRPEWNKSDGDIPADLLSFGVIAGVLDPGMKLAGAALALWLTTKLATFGAPLFPVEAPMYLQIALVFLIAEFGKYWAHRWHHENAFLWDVHAMHHAPARLYMLNNFRLHPVNYMISYFFSLFPLALMGTPIEPLLVYSTIAVAVTFFQHANIDLKYGPLNYVFSTSRLHRWHHSAALPEGNRNYGSTLIIWDLVFGSFHHPKDLAAPEKLGISDANYPARGYLKQFIWPVKLRCCPLCKVR